MARKDAHELLPGKAGGAGDADTGQRIVGRVRAVTFNGGRQGHRIQVTGKEYLYI
jgi:hypothetical protein